METTDAGVKAENVSGKSAGKGVDKTITMEPIPGMEHPWRYRNKAQFPFDAIRMEESLPDFTRDAPTILWKRRIACWVSKKMREFWILSRKSWKNTRLRHMTRRRTRVRFAMH